MANESTKAQLRSRLGLQLLTVTRLKAELKLAIDTYNSLERQLVKAVKADHAPKVKK